ncbi:hypothetical protein AAC387_Pa01g3827 [Persea americana]
MELEDLRSDLNALKKLYGLLQSKGNILQVSGSENLDDTSRQLLKKLLDGATEQAFQSHSKITTEKSSASVLPDSLQKLPTSNTNPSMEKETPKSAQAPEERDESQSHQGASAAELQKKLKRETRKEGSFCRICEKSDAKGQILSTKEKNISSDSNEKTQMMNKNHVHRPGHGRFKTQDHLSKTEQGKQLESREEETQGPLAKIHKNPRTVGLGPHSTISLLVLHKGSENGPLELNKKKEKKSKTGQTTISDEAAMAIRRIDDHLPVKKEPENSIIVPGQMLIQHPFQVKELPTHHQHVKAPNLQTNELKSWPVETSGPTMKADDLLPIQHKCRRTDNMDPPPDHTPNESSLLMGKSTNQMSEKALEDQRSRCTVRLVGPTLERTLTQRKKDAKVSEFSGPDQKRKQQTTDRKINPHALHKTETKRKISASSSIKVPTNLNRHRVHKKERDSTDRMMSRITGPRPSRPERILTTRTVDNVLINQKQKQKQRVRSRQSHTQDPAKHAPKVGPTLEKLSTRIISSSGPVKALHGEMIDGQDSNQQKKRMRHQLTWKETPRRTNRKPIQEKSTSSCTSCSSASRTSDSSSTPSRRVARADSRERKLPNRMLTHRALAAEMRLPRRTMTHHAVPTPNTRKLPLPPPPREKRSLTKPKIHGKALPHKEESSDRMVGPLSHVGPTTSANVTHQVEEKRTEGRLRRFRNKLGIIFHHHHHHHHHHHLGGHQSGVNGEDDDRSESSEVVHHHHRSLWRYLRDMMHHTAKEGHVKLAAEVGRERAEGTVGKSVVRRATRKQQKGHLHALVERLLRHLWHSKKQQKRLGKSGSRKIHSNNNNKGKKVKQHWWQRFHGRRGVKLANHKNARPTLSFRRPKDKKTV